MKKKIGHTSNVATSFAEKIFYFNKKNIVLTEMRKKESIEVDKVVKDFWHKLYYGF